MLKATGRGKLPSERTTVLQMLQRCADDQAMFERNVTLEHLELLLDCARFACAMAPDDDAVLALMEEWEE